MGSVYFESGIDASACVEDEHPEGHFEEGLASSSESVLGALLIDTSVVEEGSARVFCKIPCELIVI